MGEMKMDEVAVIDHQYTKDMGWPYVLLRTVLFLALFGTSGCRDLLTEPEVGIPSTIVLDRDILLLGSLGQQATVRALVLDQQGREVNVPLVWFTDDPAVATVESDQQVRARRNGETVLTVMVDVMPSRALPAGYRSGRPLAVIPIIVRQDVGSFEFESPKLSLWAVGQTSQMRVEIRDPMGSPFERAITVRWESSDPAIIEVRSDGRVVARDDGAAQVRAVTEEGAGAALVQVATRFTFVACVSSSASRASGNFGSGGSPHRCADLPLQAIAADSTSR